MERKKQKMSKSTIFIKRIPVKHNNGKVVANRIINYLETYVYSHNDVSELDKELGIVFVDDNELLSDPLETLDFRKYNVMSGKLMQMKEKTYIHSKKTDKYPQIIHISQQDLDDLIEYNPNCMVDGKIFGIEVKVI